jgi:hypothetical protein
MNKNLLYKMCEENERRLIELKIKEEALSQKQRLYLDYYTTYINIQLFRYQRGLI